MNRKRASLILLVIFSITVLLSISSIFLDDANTIEKENGTLTINNQQRHYEKSGKCVEVIDANTIQVYGVGRVQLTQIGNATNKADDFVKDRCLGKIVYLNIDDKQPKDRYGRTLAVVYTEECDINQELLKNNMAQVSYFEPSEFEKGKV